MGACDRVRFRLAIGFAPARCKPRGRVVIQRVAFQKYFFAGTDKIAQDAIDERSVGRVFRLEAGRADSEIDGGVIGHLEKENLSRRRNQGPFEVGGLPRQAFFQKSGQGGANGTEPAQRDGHNGARQGDVAWFQTAKPRKYRRARKAFVERMISSDNIVQDRCGGETRGKTWAILSLAPMVLRGNDIAWPAVRNLAATPPVCRRTRRFGQTRDSAAKASETRIISSY